jgi:hypothetical protein
VAAAILSCKVVLLCFASLIIIIAAKDSFVQQLSATFRSNNSILITVCPIKQFYSGSFPRALLASSSTTSGSSQQFARLSIRLEFSNPYSIPLFSNVSSIFVYGSCCSVIIVMYCIGEKRVVVGIFNVDF